MTYARTMRARHLQALDRLAENAQEPGLDS
jgi:hypothetical protein